MDKWTTHLTGSKEPWLQFFIMLLELIILEFI